MSLLEVDGLRVAFGGVVAVDDVSFEVDEGTMVGFIGPNGAGKTTSIDALTGYLPHASGRVVFDGTDISAMRPHQRARRGLVRTFQAVELFDDLTVRGNLRAAGNRRRWWESLGDLVMPRWHDDQSIIDDTLALLGLDSVADALPGELSQGQRKLAGVARALACSPKLLLLDEPAAGLDSSESSELGVRLRHIVDRGVAVLLVDHDMSLVLGSCDSVVVLDFGRVIARGTPEDVRSDAGVVAAYLGDDLVGAHADGAR
jgi:branched-chain amino acid transport system ATP-binding protein